MKAFILGLIVGIALAVCGYKPYQIEMEYRNNVANGLAPIRSFIPCSEVRTLFSERITL
jgi:hypothetical protein